MAGPAHGLTRQGLQLALTLGPDPLVKVSLGTRLRLVETLNHLKLLVDDRLVAAVAAHGTDVVGRPLAAPDTVPVTVLALAEGVVVLGAGAGGHTERAVLDVFTLDAVARPRPGARHVTLAVALHARPVLLALVEALGGVTGLHALGLRHEILAGQTELIAGAPAALARALRVAHVLLLVADLRRLVVLQERVVALGLHDLLPADVLSVAEVIIF